MSRVAWRPQWNLRAALKRTIDWYRAYYWHEGVPELCALCERQIGQYEARGRCASSSQVIETLLREGEAPAEPLTPTARQEPRPPESICTPFVAARPEVP